MSAWSWNRFIRSQAGVAMIEFAVGLPILILMLFGSVELTRFILINQKIDKATNTLDDLATRQLSVTDQFMNQLTDSMPKFLRPFNFEGSNVQVVFTFVRREAAPNPEQQAPAPRVTRQYSKIAGAVGRSKIGSVGTIANMPFGFELQPKEHVIVVESFYEFKSILGDAFLPSRSLYKVAVMRPRIEQEPLCPTGCRAQGSPPDDTSNGCFQRPICPPPPCNVKCPPKYTMTAPACNIENCPCPACVDYPEQQEDPDILLICDGNPPPICEPVCKPCLRSWEHNPPGCEPVGPCVCRSCRPINQPVDQNCPEEPECCKSCYYPSEDRPPGCEKRPACPQFCPKCPGGHQRCPGTPPDDCHCEQCPHQ